MPTPILATKLYTPPPRPVIVRRPRLIEQLNDGLHRRLTLISAPAGFGKTTLVSEWVARCDRPAAWLSLDEADSDPPRFLTYLVAALQTIAPQVGARTVALLQSPQPPPIEAILTTLLNDITTIPHEFILVLDDYHAIEARPIDQALVFLIEHQPPQMHLVIATREDPQLPLARWRARGQLVELRAADLRFTPPEAATFLNQAMGLDLAADDIAALETRTEGWIAGLQLAALSMQGHHDTAGFIRSFTGSHRFVLDYLVEEVLHQQPERVQAFLLHTAILDRLCAPLCDAVLLDQAAASQATLEYLERANLFLIPLDNERRWYRYHQLFADMLRQRLHQSGVNTAEVHLRASQWYEDQGLEIAAFQHAAAANDIQRAERLIDGKGMPLHFRGAVTPVLTWLESLPARLLDARPSLWVTYASALSMTGQLTGVEPKLQAAEAALRNSAPSDETRNLLGHIAAIRALLAAAQNQVDLIVTESQRALELLRPDNLPVRTATLWKLGLAYQLQGNRAAARRAYTESLSISQASGNTIIGLSALIGLANIEEAENQLAQAAQTYGRVLRSAGDPPLPVAGEAHLGLARLCYEWNDLAASEQHALQILHVAPQFQHTDRFVARDVVLARLKLARGDVTGAIATLTAASQFARQYGFVHRLPEVAEAHVLALLRQGDLAAAADLALAHGLPVSQARVHLARGATSAALALLEPLRQRVEAQGQVDAQLKVMLLQAVALYNHGEHNLALRLLGEALARAEPGGLVRRFVDEGAPMARLLAVAAARRLLPAYVTTLLAAFEADQRSNTSVVPLPSAPSSHPLIEPLSQRELEILRLIAQGLSNHEISARLFLALSTVKGHNRNIFDKLGVQRRTEAVARARELGLL